jgi:hypothetical protein
VRHSPTPVLVIARQPARICNDEQRLLLNTCPGNFYAGAAALYLDGLLRSEIRLPLRSAATG